MESPRVSSRPDGHAHVVTVSPHGHLHALDAVFTYRYCALRVEEGRVDSFEGLGQMKRLKIDLAPPGKQAMDLLGFESENLQYA